jgi:hypothetical protein
MSDPESGPADPRRADEGETPAFRVIDRRRFAPDGSERSEAEQTAEQAAPAKPESAASAKPAAPASGAGPRPAAASASSGPELATPTGAPYEDRPDASFEPSFGTLLISLSTQALMYLGEIPDLEGGAAHKDLAAARNIIDLIAVLERKTAGNLDADEAALLERILYDLRMRFVEISRG